MLENSMRPKGYKYYPFIFIILSITVFGELSGTAFSGEAKPPAEEGKRDVRTIAVLPPDVDYYLISAGGIPEKIDEECLKAEKNLLAAVEQELGEKSGKALKYFTIEGASGEMLDNLGETMALFGAVQHAILSAPQGHSVRPEALDYTLGHEVNELSGGADAVLIITGTNYISTGGRKAVEVAKSMILSVLLFVQPEAPTDISVLSAALVDARTGALMWFGISRDSFNFGYDKAAAVALKYVLKDFPFGQ